MRRLTTKFAPAERSDRTEIDIQAAKIKQIPELSAFLDAVPTIYMILNKNRQIVYANKTMLEYLDIDSQIPVLGMRPGEVLKCKHAFENDGGCGTSEACRSCGAVKAILSSLNQKADIQDCHIEQIETQNAFDLRIWTTPYSIDDDIYSIFAVTDISHEKRRRALERVFFHDILNTAGGLRGLAELLKESPTEVNDYKDIIYNLTEKLIDEIEAQKELAAAENNELSVYYSQTNTIKILVDLTNLYKNHEVARSREIKIDSMSSYIEFRSDERLIRRVVGNMLKNAIEATPPDETVLLGAKKVGNEVQFYVHNPNYIPRHIQLQIFKRSFSTKGSDRGLGTYGMKLLSERYLKGRVWFESELDEGTTFYAAYPLDPDQLPTN